MAASDTRTTTDHDTIRAWAEDHDGVPATVSGTAGDDEAGVLTLDIVGYGAGEGELEHIEWDTWFEKFEDAGLAFLYQEQKASGEDSTFFKLVSRQGVTTPSETRTTTDHDTIRTWAEDHDGVPASVSGTAGDDDAGVLTLDIVGYGAGEGELEHIEWDTWFEKFEDAGLAFLYQEQKASGEDSTFFKLVSREGADTG